MATTAKQAAEKREKKKRHPIRSDFIRLYGKQVPEFQLNEQEFRFTLIRPGERNVALGRLVESCEWRDEGAPELLNVKCVLRGTLQLRLPEGRPFMVRDGYEVRCDVSWGSRWVEVWRMRLLTPKVDLEGSGRYELADDSWLLAQSEGTFRYKKGRKRHKKGWTYDEIVRDIAKRYRVPLGQIQPGVKRFTDFSHNKISPLDAIQRLVEAETKFTGKPLVMAWRRDARRGRSGLSITPLRRNPVLYLFKEQIRSATVGLSERARLKTALVVTGKGKVKKDGTEKAVKVKTRVIHEGAVRHYGYIEREVKLKGDIESRREAREEGKKLLAKDLERVKVIEDFSHSGIAFVRRGDAIRIKLPDYGIVGARPVYKGKGKKRKVELREEAHGKPSRRKTRALFEKQGEEIAFVAGVTHMLTTDDYTMSMTLSVKDPQDPNKLRAEREKAVRAEKRKTRKKDASAA